MAVACLRVVGVGGDNEFSMSLMELVFAVPYREAIFLTFNEFVFLEKNVNVLTEPNMEMDFPLWDQPEDQDESSYPTYWQYNFYFDPRLEPGVGSSNLPEDLNKTEAIGDHVGSSNPPEDLNKKEAIGDHNSKDIETVKFQGGCRCSARLSNTILASLPQVRYQQQTPAGTTLKDKHVLEQETKGLKAVQNNDPSGGMKGQEVARTGTDRTVEEAWPRLLSFKGKEKIKPQKTKRGGDDYVYKTIEGTQQLAGAKRAGDFAGISATSRTYHFRKRSETSFRGPVIQGNNNQRGVQNVLVSSSSKYLSRIQASY
ncbi:hypothetical protein FXO38_34764 [Capsicum annuum]|nr:hypothetical protein FXO38_34764 [Capsicum annuum]